MFTHQNLEPVEKEEIKFLHFPREDVLSKIEDRRNRRMELQKAMSLGNLSREKVKIFFRDDQGLKKVESSIWKITDKAVILKKSTLIPLERILGVA